MTTPEKYAEHCMQALISEDYATYAEYIHARLMEVMGGAPGLAIALGRATARMQAEGLKFVNVALGEPAAPRAMGGWLVTLVPQTITMQQRSRRQSGHLEIHSFLVAISEDAGSSWQFLDAATVQDPDILDLYPELEGLELPAPTEPTFRPDP